MDNKADTGALPTQAQLTPTYLKAFPTCPSGGTYTIAAIGSDPTCSIATHALPY
jgi:hypothetical protein